MHDPRAVKVTSTENGTQPEKSGSEIEISGCIFSFIHRTRGRYRDARTRRAGAARARRQATQARRPRQVEARTVWATWAIRIRIVSDGVSVSGAEDWDDQLQAKVQTAK